MFAIGLRVILNQKVSRQKKHHWVDIWLLKSWFSCGILFCEFCCELKEQKKNGGCILGGTTNLLIFFLSQTLGGGFHKSISLMMRFRMQKKERKETNHTTTTNGRNNNTSTNNFAIFWKRIQSFPPAFASSCNAPVHPKKIPNKLLFFCSHSAAAPLKATRMWLRPLHCRTILP
jgi:hypothetical protein